MTDEFEIELRPKSRLLMAGGGSFAVLDDYETAKAKVEEAGLNELIEFPTYMTLGDPTDLKRDPCTASISRDAIMGVMQVTKAAWDDEQRDRKHAALVPRLGGFGIETP